MKIPRLVNRSMVFLILQWTARSLIANGQEFKTYIYQLKEKPDVICIQETWLKTNLDFIIGGYSAIRQDRNDGQGGGCAIFIREVMSFSRLTFKSSHDLEIVGVEVWINKRKMSVLNFYNPGNKLKVEELNSLCQGNEIIWCGDFNAHNTMWGGRSTNYNGQVVEDLMEAKELVCLNNGQGTRLNFRDGTESAIDLTLVTSELATGSSWEVLANNSIGSDHLPIIIKFDLSNVVELDGIMRWNFAKTNWEMFAKLCDNEFDKIDMAGSIDEINEQFTSNIIKSANQTIENKIGKLNKCVRMVPWWNKECKEAIRNKIRLFGKLRKTHSLHNLIEYKKAQSQVRKIVKRAKRECWRGFCSSIGRTTPLDKIWGMIKKMRGIRQQSNLPVLENGGEVATSAMEKAEILAKNFVKAHSSENLTEEGKIRRQEVLDEHPNVYEERHSSQSVVNVPFSIQELRRALSKCKMTAPGKDNVCYIMLTKLSDGALGKLLEMYNKIWEKGKLPIIWKESVIIPISKPGKDPTSPGSYRPIALTSHLCKVMERMITERLTYYIEKMN